MITGLEFSGSFDEGYLAGYVGVENGFEGEYLSEKCMEFKVRGLQRDVIICGDTSA